MAIRIDLNIHSGDAAFEPSTAAAEAARILRLLAQDLENGSEGDFHFRDVNGNTCGTAFVEIWDDETA